MKTPLKRLYREKIILYLVLAERRNQGEDVRVELTEAEGALEIVWALLVGMEKRPQDG